MKPREQTITYADGRTQTVRILPYDLIRVERDGTYGKSENGMRLLHSAVTRGTGLDLDFDAWAADVEDVTAEGGDEPADPTRPDRGDGS